VPIYFAIECTAFNWFEQLGSVAAITGGVVKFINEQISEAGCLSVVCWNACNDQFQRCYE